MPICLKSGRIARHTNLVKQICRKKFWNDVPACVLLIKSYRNAVPARPVTKIALLV
jgi:hypothetical protein